MDIPSSARLSVRPETEKDLTKLAEDWLHRADAVDVLPTPLEQICEVAKVTEYEMPQAVNDGLLKRFSSGAIDILQNALNKVRGMADVRERAIYIPQGDSDPRRRFVRGHEIAHNLIPWQKIRHGHLDMALSLTADARFEFDREANFMSGELNFQGPRFVHRARSYAANLEAIDVLACRHETSFQATLWRYAEVQDEKILVAMYYPNWRSELNLWKYVPSPAFEKRFPDINLPTLVDPLHPWYSARELGQDTDGEIDLDCGSDGCCIFRWQARWNQHALLVVVRRMPKLHMVGRILRAA